MLIKITYKRLVSRLQKVGYVTKRMVGSHMIMFHPKYNSSIVLPSAKATELVPHYFLRVIRKNIIEKGVLTEEQYIELLTGGD